MEKEHKQVHEGRLQGLTLFSFTDNLVTYYIVQSGSSLSSELHKLIREIKRLELLLGCRVEVVHVPCTMMIDQGTDGCSRGLPMAVSQTPDVVSNLGGSDPGHGSSHPRDGAMGTRGR
jgi:hypothetical protein